jgi:superfamily II DNA or RNA helicase
LSRISVKRKKAVAARVVRRGSSSSSVAVAVAEVALPAVLRAREPRCDLYSDERAVREHELAVRRWRAQVERSRLQPPPASRDRHLDGPWVVRVGEGEAWAVDVVDATGAFDTCTCPDFATSGLGLCKHLAAVQRAIAERHVTGAVPPSPRRPTVTLTVRGGALALVLVGPHDARVRRWFARGRLTLDALEAPPPGVRITNAVARFVRTTTEQEARAARSAELAAAQAAGRLVVDVLAAPLFPYQRDGVAHLVSRGRAVLADDMGLGKTVQAIAAAEVLRRRGEVRRVLVVTPASLKAQWAREIARYGAGTAIVVGGQAAERRRQLASDAPFVIANYELLWRDLAAFRGERWDLVIVDEAQRAKNFRTRTATTLRTLASEFLFVLTGTPVENRLDDLYALLQLVDPTVLGPLWRFNLDFHEQGRRGRVVGYKNLGELRRRTAPLVLRRRKEEVLSQLPPLTHQTRYVALDERQAALEAEHRDQAARLAAIAERRALTADEQQRLMGHLVKARQACDAAVLCDPDAPPRSGKLDELAALCREVIDSGPAKVLVFSEWTEMLRLAARRLDEEGIAWAMLHGGVPVADRPALLDRFRAEPDVRVLLSTDAGGVGLNLQVASYVVHLDLPWNPGRLDQRTARAHRLGQSRGVSVTYLCAERGIERGIEGTLAGKRSLRAAALDVASEVDTLEAPSFATFVKDLARVLRTPGVAELPPAEAAPSAPTDEALEAIEAIEAIEAAPAQVSMASPVAPATEAPAIDDGAPPASPAPAPAVASGPSTARRQPGDRLRLAEVVLAAGFPNDAVVAAYDALATALRELSPEPVPAGHGALVACVYRTLVPTGRVAAAVQPVLARAHDLASLREHDVGVAPEDAAALVDEVRAWLTSARAGSPPAAG